MTEKLIVCKGVEAVGSLLRGENDAYNFTYEETWLTGKTPQPLSLSLPLKKGTFAADITKAFFSNLLPEGQLREHYANKFRLSPEDDFELLARVAGDCAGAIALYPEGQTPQPETGPHKYRSLSEEELTQLLAEPFIMDPCFLEEREQIRLSLAGVQDKLPVVAEGDTVKIPLHGAPSKHILKPQSHHFKSLAENELFCMTLAGAMGLDTPRTFLLTLANETCYLVERYDRHLDSAGWIKRIHQEDFCQATGTSHQRKYEERGGPGHRECFNIIKRCRNPLADRIKLTERTIFNYLIGNADCHAKNISLLYSNSVHPDLAPCYDLVCTAIYPQLSKTLAMSIGGEFDPRNINRASWEVFARETGEGSARPTLATIERMAKSIGAKAITVQEELVNLYGTNSVYEQIVYMITKQAEVALRQIVR